jgi:hypothetical protein
MKRGGKGPGDGAAAATTPLLLVALLLLVAASMRADARRLSGPNPNPCTHDPNKPGSGCQVPPPGKQAAAAHTEAQSRRLISVSGMASVGPGRSNCSHDPNAPPGRRCPTPPAKSPWFHRVIWSTAATFRSIKFTCRVIVWVDQLM